MEHFIEFFFRGFERAGDLFILHNLLLQFRVSAFPFPQFRVQAFFNLKQFRMTAPQFFLRLSQAQMRLDSGEDFCFREWRIDIIHATSLKRADFRLFIFQHADENDRNLARLRIGFHAAADFSPSDVRHVHIQYDEVGQLRSNAAQCRFAVTRHADVVSGFPQ
ncbi:hypothetical protein U14_00256 [Candidatus Moduliflexus flocculans]|uniref:Uncharacterized protein n=1 Tax=Candidatus Moduliflexus flocculans TaxID=1499966 RepID=A0A0S6VWE4_9BACT|nr:hypothetical protein U14_00256 [Candidatus Moduliflexus flocculans]